MSPSPPSGQTEKNRSSGLFGRLRDKLAATQRSFTRGLSDLLLGNRALDDALRDHAPNLRKFVHLPDPKEPAASEPALGGDAAMYYALLIAILLILILWLGNRTSL